MFDIFENGFTDDFGNRRSWFEVKKEPVWKDGFIFQSYTVKNARFARLIVGSGIWQLIRLPD